jgi:hypothetical protein
MASAKVNLMPHAIPWLLAIAPWLHAWYHGRLQEFVANFRKFLREVSRTPDLGKCWKAIKRIEVAEGVSRPEAVEISKALVYIFLACQLALATIHLLSGTGTLPQQILIVLVETVVSLLSAFHWWIIGKEKEGKDFPGLGKLWICLFALSYLALSLWDVAYTLRSIYRFAVRKTLLLWVWDLLVHIISLFACGIMGHGLLVPAVYPQQSGKNTRLSPWDEERQQTVRKYMKGQTQSFQGPDKSAGVGKAMECFIPDGAEKPIIDFSALEEENAEGHVAIQHYLEHPSSYLGGHDDPVMDDGKAIVKFTMTKTLLFWLMGRGQRLVAVFEFEEGGALVQKLTVDYDK